jgi:glutamyl-tRNA synthetase
MGTCTQLTAEQVAQKIAAGEKPTLRFRVPADQSTGFVDLVRGEQQFNNNDIGDFIIRRADGTAPFMYCNAIDDALMGVTHALRGEDHLTNTPRQLMILQALGLPTPHYGHISLIIGHDGAPLSKRHGSRNIQELRAEGYLPMAIVNYLARLGHHYSNEHWMTLAELAEKFSINSLGAAPARFDAHQLLRWQHETLLRLSIEELWHWLGADVQKAIPATQKDLFLQTIRTNIAFPADALHWAQRLFTDNWDYGDAEQQVLQTASSAFFHTAITAAETHGANLEAITAALKTQQNVKGKQLFQPLRVALTGELNGPELVPVLEILGADGVVARLKRALNTINL